MSNINTEGLPPEMQARIADIIQQAKNNAIQPVGQQAPAPQAPPAPQWGTNANGQLTSGMGRGRGAVLPAWATTSQGPGFGRGAARLPLAPPTAPGGTVSTGLLNFLSKF